MINTYATKAGFCLLTICSLNAMEKKEGIDPISLLVEKQEITYVPSHLEKLDTMAMAEMFASFSCKCTNQSPIHLFVSFKELCTMTNHKTKEEYTCTLRSSGQLRIKPYIGKYSMRSTAQAIPLSAYHIKIESPQEDDALIINLTHTAPLKSTKKYFQKIPWNAVFNHNYHSQKPNQVITKTHNTEVCVEQDKEVKWPLLRCNIAITYTHKILYSESINREKI